jgi:creatinine amidohydrolase/Fe(II)-dependent formamide hydrolase-like protein
MGLYLFENLIKMENVKQEAKTGGTNLPGVETPVDWQAYAVQLYLGDPRLATKEKGRILVERIIDFVADAIRRIKQDEKVPLILDDFYRKAYGQ